jgi:GNAT superfamily N-acetyltransferase
VATSDWTLAPATAADVPGIMRVIEECFSLTSRSRAVFGAPCADRYFTEMIRRQDTGGDGAFIVARSADARVVGFVEIRRLPGCVHLNNMATSAVARGQGVYAALMAAAIRLGRADGYTQASLDVFVDNPIRAFQFNVGYRVTGTVTWHAVVLPAGPRPAGVYFGGLPQADAVHAWFGFSQMTAVTTGGARHDVGRLGHSWFRVTDPAVVAERDILVALHNLDAARYLLAIVPLGTALPADLDAQHLGTSERLMGDIATLLPAIESRAGQR